MCAKLLVEAHRGDDALQLLQVSPLSAELDVLEYVAYAKRLGRSDDASALLRAYADQYLDVAVCLAWETFNRGHHDPAIELLEPWVAASSNAARVTAEFLLVDHRLPEAELVLRQWCTTDPRSMLIVARILVLLGRVDEAEEVLVVGASRSSKVAVQLAKLRKPRGDWDAIAEILAPFAANPEIVLQYAGALNRAGRRTEAIEALDRASAGNPVQQRRIWTLQRRMTDLPRGDR